MRNLACYAFAILMPLGLSAGVNSITLKDGRTFSGRFMNGNGTTVSFQDDSGSNYRFNTNEVQSINFATGQSNGMDRRGYNQNGSRNQDNQGNYNRDNGYNNNQGNNNRDNSYNNNQGNDNRGYNNARNANNSNGRVRTIPSGSELSVRTTQAIDSKNSTEGQVFAASVEKDVMDQNGNVVIPRGSEAQLVVKDASGGRVMGSNNLTLDVQSVTVNGQRYLVNTEDLQRSGGDGVGKNRRTAEYVGGGTALGTLLGAIGGGGKGALIGAIAGAAAGTGVQVLTKGSQVRVPSETVLTFRLDQPMQLNPSSY